MNDKYAEKLDSLGFELPPWCDPPSEELVAAFESQFSLELPLDYRELLIAHGGKCYGHAVCSFQEPTPCGPETMIDCFYGFAPPERSESIARATEIIDGAPSVVAIGSNQLGAMFWLICAGDDAGYVCMHDHEGRSAWSDAYFREMYPNLAPEIKSYLQLRKRGALPVKPDGYEHVYRLAKSFSEFFEGLRPSPHDADDSDTAEAPAGILDKIVSYLPRFLRNMLGGTGSHEDQENAMARIVPVLKRRDDGFLQGLVAAGKLNQPIADGMALIEIAAVMDDPKALQWLLNAGAAFRDALFYAANNNRVDAVRFLVENGCDVETRWRGMTPLMLAVRCPSELKESLATARILMEHGANVNAVSDEGKSVLKIAGGERYSNGRTQGPPELIALLEAAGAKLN